MDHRWGTAAALMQAAGTSGHAAKGAGRNCVRAWFDTDRAMRTRHGEMQWASCIEQALDEDRFELHAQRITALTGRQSGPHAEVLLRMCDAGGGLVMPRALLPAAECFPLACRVDRWVLKHVIDCLKQRGAPAGVPTLSLNLSGQSIGNRAFHRQALDVLSDAGDAIRRCLCLEITETAADADASGFDEATDPCRSRRPSVMPGRDAGRIVSKNALGATRCRRSGAP